MKQVFISPKTISKVYLNEVSEKTPVFIKFKGKLSGMLVQEPSGWIARIGGPNGSSGHYPTRDECAQKAVDYGHELFIED